MDIFGVLNMICGLALFLYGMHIMGDGLTRMSGGKLETILEKLTNNTIKAVLLGAAVTAVIQSSSATTVMLVGFVNSGTMLLSQAISVILGANLGTAVTAWLTALNSLGNTEALSAIAFLDYLTPDFWMPILAIIGIAFIMFSKRDKQKDVGTILVGFAVLMVGMSTMSGAVAGLKNDPEFAKILTIFSNPIIGVIVGAVLTAIVQSSSASIGILQALSVTGGISFGMAIPIVLGQNIGTCVTAMLSALGANKNGKRTAVAHLFFNVIGVVFWLSMYYLVGWILNLVGVFDLFKLAEATIDPFGIAIVHTVFKILAIALMWPFTKLLEKLACTIVKGDDKKGDEYTSMLDERLLDTPSVALDRCRVVAAHMAELSIKPLENAITLLEEYDPKAAQAIRDAEDKVDIYEDALGSYLVKLASRSMSEEDSAEITKLLHMIGDLERISDHSVNLVESAEEIKDKNISFSEQAVRELKTMYSALEEISEMTVRAFVDNDMDCALSVEPLEEVVDDLKDQIRINHVIRVQKSQCTIEHGFILSDILTNLERVSDHCSNIAGCLIEISRHHEALDLHNYLHELKEAEGTHFNEQYKKYSEKYSIKSDI